MNQCHRLVQLGFADGIHQSLKRGDVTHDKVAQEAFVAQAGVLPQFRFKRADALIEAGGSGHQPGLKNRLHVLEPRIAQMLGKADKARGVNIGLFGYTGDRLQGYNIGILRQIAGNLLEPPAQLRITLDDLIR